jgi:ubiquinone/menaquinone biosynthesis C-methylase UbiE
MTSLAMEIGARVPEPVQAVAYRAQQLGVLHTSLLGHRILRMLARKPVRPDPAAIGEVQRRYRALLERDLENVRAGHYPKALLFQFPFVDYLRSAPFLALDVPRTLLRMRRGDYRDLPDDVDLQAYPPYFRRNFHWQTDGYLSRRSAAIYDVGVELLFLGTADVMRRMVIPPVSRFAREHGDDLRLCDVGCGTGRMLHQLSVALPRLRYYGLDLSAFYLQHAGELCAGIQNLSLVADNAEHMPLRDGFFDVLTSVHLFHELPDTARHNVYAEMFRVLRPGGLVVIEDSAQIGDAGGIGFYVSNFSSDFHEPFHKSYVEDDIALALERAGFQVESSEGHFVSKVVVARKPAG